MSVGFNTVARYCMMNSLTVRSFVRSFVCSFDRSFVCSFDRSIDCSLFAECLSSSHGPKSTQETSKLGSDFETESRAPSPRQISAQAFSGLPHLALLTFFHRAASVASLISRGCPPRLQVTSA